MYAKQIAPRDTRGHLGVQTFKSIGKLSNGWTDWHQLWFTSADSSGNGHRLNTSRPSLPQGAFLGLLGGHKFKSLGKLLNGWTDWHHIWYVCGFVWEWTYAKYNSPLNTPGSISVVGLGLGSHKFKSLWKLSIGWTDWQQT